VGEGGRGEEGAGGARALYLLPSLLAEQPLPLLLLEAGVRLATQLLACAPC
jgi:hypothetical protein